MKHTKESLAAMSDFERNECLAGLLGFVTREIPPSICLVRHSFGLAEIDYCNNPSDVMPLVFEHKIGLAPNKDSYEAFHLADNFQIVDMQYNDTSPLRAAACCLILVLQEGQR